MDEELRRDRGKEIMDRLDPDATRNLRQSLQDIAPDVIDFVLEFAYGDIMAREGLDLKTRELCIIASLTAMGGCEHELRIHLKKAIHIGVTEKQIVEVLLQQCVYCGFPRAINALIVAKELFEQQNAT